MSFSSEIKRELCDTRSLTPSQSSAMLCGILFACRSEDGRPVLQTENPELLSTAAELLKSVFPDVHSGTVRMVRSSGSLYTLRIRSGWEQVAERFGDMDRISGSVVAGSDEDSGAFLRGVFVTCGSVTDPNKEYHLELVLPENHRTGVLLDLITEHGMAFKETFRGGSRTKRRVIYAKESELIEDFLTYIGAANHSLEIMQVKIVKDFRNRVNRSVNCESANLDKTVAAAGKSAEDIEYIFRTMGADWLSPELQETARLRLEHQEMSLSELCGLFAEPISRSGLNHRLKKLSRLAEELRRTNAGEIAP